MRLSLTEAKKVLHDNGYSQVRMEGNALKIETIAQGDDPIEYKLLLKYDEKELGIVVEGAWELNPMNVPAAENDITLTWENEYPAMFIQKKIEELEELLKLKM
ncbi:MAG: hypothetical protein ACHQ03_03905 [Candidatus Bathyarchaeia archaeon]